MSDRQSAQNSDVPAPPSRVRRIVRYVRRMAPPAAVIPFGAGLFLAVYFSLQALAGVAPLQLTWRAGPAMLTMIVFVVLLRVYDELKDVESDLRLARAGDPRYVDRPIAKGEITIADLQLLRWLLTGVLIAANLPLGVPFPLAGFAVAFVLTWASFKWFFYPSMKNNLLLAFATHNPLALVMAGYVVGVYVADFGPIGLGGQTVLLLVGLWMPVAAWETSRKVRIPEDETTYQTYSVLLGWRVAALVPVLFVTASVACLVAIAGPMSLGPVYAALLVSAAAVPTGACVLFRVAPTRRRARLRPYVELYVAAVSIGLPVALVWRHGMQMG